MKPETLHQKQAAERFFAEAFCIDGIAEIIPANNFIISAVVRLTDSKRGTFYVAHVTPGSPTNV